MYICILRLAGTKGKNAFDVEMTIVENYYTYIDDYNDTILFNSVYCLCLYALFLLGVCSVYLYRLKLYVFS